MPIGIEIGVKSSAILCLSYEYPPLGGGGSRVVFGLTRALVAARKRVGAGHEYTTDRYSLNHTHFIFPGGLVAYLLKKATGLKYVVTAHGSDVPNYNPDRFGLLHKLLRPLWIGITSQAECIVCPSRTLQSLIVQGNPTAGVTVIPNGVDCRQFSPDVRKQELAVRAKFWGPIVLLEAMSAGLAIITTENTGAEEAVGDCALLVGVGDSTAIAQRLRELVEDSALCERLGRRARHRAEDLFDWPRVGLQYQRIFDGACGNAGD
jgi:glycosyltransferase involved in cell wall biosynthesis